MIILVVLLYLAFKINRYREYSYIIDLRNAFISDILQPKFTREQIYCLQMCNTIYFFLIKSNFTIGILKFKTMNVFKNNNEYEAKWRPRLLCHITLTTDTSWSISILPYLVLLRHAYFWFVVSRWQHIPRDQFPSYLIRYC